MMMPDTYGKAWPGGDYGTLPTRFSLVREQCLSIVQWAQANPEAHDRLIDQAMPWWRAEERQLWNRAHPTFGEGGING